ncbi:MAG: U32 family peptidase [Melioribacteraceae bacterium]|nr:U32 family peptidase [Melioribacteraceae bacterium]MCF8412568.1 U32 family peptidase [Melioribacteraceae bacterium]MCF8431035.1 U32 family peptidase [Melioribacteraceae bacterium]
MSSELKKPKLLAPAGDWRMLNAAINNGADAVYFGVEVLNMRAKARNFVSDELSELVTLAKEKNIETNLTINTIVFEDELSDLDQIILKAKNAGIDFVICWDMAAIEKCIQHEMAFCISTQASISNSASAKMYERLGAKRIVTARECSLEQIKEIKQNTNLEVEAFIHGAMCVAVSGRCFMSHEAFGKSANRGECIQPCRREFEIRDKDGQSEFIIGEDYVMSPKDLCTIEFVDQLIESGIDVFKIEGRKRAPEYIAKVVSTYRKAIDLYFENKLTYEIKKEMLAELGKVYNRGFSRGFYFENPNSIDFSEKYGSSATTKKVYIGKVVNYFDQAQVAHILLQAGDLDVGDSIYVIGEKTGAIEMQVDSMFVNDVEAEHADKKDEITFKCSRPIRKGDQIYKIVEVEVT